MNIIKQSTYETCLACCLIMLLEKDNTDEIEIWKHGWKFNYLIGQLNYISETNNRKITAHIENKIYHQELLKQKNDGVNLVNDKINTDLLFELLSKGKVIVYLDVYYLQGILHAPHFVVAIEKVGDSIKIADPADGQMKMITIKVLDQAIESLRNHLKYSPVLVQLK